VSRLNLVAAVFKADKTTRIPVGSFYIYIRPEYMKYAGIGDGAVATMVIESDSDSEEDHAHNGKSGKRGSRPKVWKRR